jgi:hypothetical protein
VQRPGKVNVQRVITNGEGSASEEGVSPLPQSPIESPVIATFASVPSDVEVTPGISVPSADATPAISLPSSSIARVQDHASTPQNDTPVAMAPPTSRGLFELLAAIEGAAANGGDTKELVAMYERQMKMFMERVGDGEYVEICDMMSGLP